MQNKKPSVGGVWIFSGTVNYFKKSCKQLCLVEHGVSMSKLHHFIIYMLNMAGRVYFPNKSKDCHLA